MPELAELEERRLLGRCIEGEAAAWRDLLARYLPFVCAVARRILAHRGLPHGQAEVEEAAADFFGDLCLRRGDALEKFRGEGCFRAYLAVLAANHARRRAERLVRERGRAVEFQEAVARREAGSEPAEFAPEEITRAVARCPPGDRLLFQLLFVDELAVERAAHFLGVSREVVYLRKHRFLARMRSLLGERSQGRWASPSG